jgi:osmoprotectant transport system ATP-binding protein
MFSNIYFQRPITRSCCKAVISPAKLFRKTSPTYIYALNPASGDMFPHIYFLTLSICSLFTLLNCRLLVANYPFTKLPIYQIIPVSVTLSVAMNDSPAAAIEFAHVTYRINGNRTLISDLNLSVRHGETLMLLGRSGSGKTTTLKLINRLLTESEGHVLVDGRSTAEWDVIQLRRHIGYAIQEAGLFPHYTVQDNVALVPRLERWDSQRIATRVREVLHLVGLPYEEFAGRYPDQLSGGQRQRVGLARALAADPAILLMDEPFGALDPITRAELQQEFLGLKKRLSKTIVFVTHDVAEALMLGDRIALMDSGELKGIFAPAEFLRSSHGAVQPYVNAFRATQQILNSGA